MAKSKNSVGRRGFLRNAAAGAAAGAAALVAPSPLLEGQTQSAQSQSSPAKTPTGGAPAPTEAQLFREAGNIQPPAVEVRKITRPGSDIMVQISSVQEALRAVGRGLMRNHLRHCAAQAIRKGNPAQAEATYDELMKLIYTHAR